MSRPPRLVIAATVAFGLLTAFWSVLTPLTEAPDEPAHLGLVHQVAETWRYPAYDGLQHSEGIFDLCIRYAVSVKWCRTPEELAAGEEHRDRPAAAAPPKHDRMHWDDPAFSVPKPGRFNQMPQHPPLYYVTMAAALRAERALVPGVLSIDTELAFLRLLNVLLVLPLPWLAWLLARRLGAGDEVGTVAALLPLGVPQLTHIGATLNNDNMFTVVVTALTVLLAGVVRGDRTRRTALLVGLTLGLALLTKGFAVILPPIVLLAYLLGTSPHEISAVSVAQRRKLPRFRWRLGGGSRSAAPAGPALARPPGSALARSGLAGSGGPGTGADRLGVDGSGLAGSGLAVPGGAGAGADRSGADRSGVDGLGLTGLGVAGSGGAGTGADGSGVDGLGLAGSGVAGSARAGSGLAGSGGAGTGADRSGVDGSGVEGSGVAGSGMAGGVVGAWLARVLRRGWRAGPLVGVAFGVGAVVGGWWYVGNLVRSGAFMPSIESSRLSPANRPPGFHFQVDRYLDSTWSRVVNGFWGDFGWRQVEVPWIVSVAVTALCLIAVARVLRRPPRLADGVVAARSWLVLLLAPIALLATFVAVRSAVIYRDSGQLRFQQGRYLFAGLVAAGVVVALAVDRRFGRRAVPATLAGVVGLQGVAILVCLRGWWGVDGVPLGSVREIVAWSGWPDPVAYALLLTAPAALAVLFTAARTHVPSAAPSSVDARPLERNLVSTGP